MSNPTERLGLHFGDSGGVDAPSRCCTIGVDGEFTPFNIGDIVGHLILDPIAPLIIPVTLDGGIINWPDIPLVLSDDTLTLHVDALTGVVTLIGNITPWPDPGWDPTPGTLEVPGETETLPKIISAQHKSFYSSVLTDKEMIRDLTLLMHQFSYDAGAPTQSIMLGPDVDQLRNEFGKWYLRYFTYREGEMYLAGISNINRGTGGCLQEIYSPVLALVKNPGDLNTWAQAEVATDEFVFDHVDTNIKRIWNGAIAVDGCTTVPDYHLILERGVPNGVNIGLLVHGLRFQVQGLNFCNNDAAGNVALTVALLMRKLFTTGVLDIERLRTNHRNMRLPFCSVPNGAGIAEYAVEHIREEYIWEKVASIPANQAFIEEPRMEIIQVPGMTAMKLPGLEWNPPVEEEPGFWSESETETDLTHLFNLRGKPTDGYKFDPYLFLAPGTIWRVRHVLDPRAVAWTMGKILQVIPAASDWQGPLPIPDMRCLVTLDTTELIYDWFDPSNQQNSHLRPV